MTNEIFKEGFEEDNEVTWQMFMESSFQAYNSLVFSCKRIDTNKYISLIPMRSLSASSRSFNDSKKLLMAITLSYSSH